MLAFAFEAHLPISGQVTHNTAPHRLLLQPPEEELKTMRRIEFLGDSDSNGFGVEGKVVRVGERRTR